MAEDPPGPRRGGGETVLLVEDEAALRRLAERALVKAGYDVLTATNGEDALRVAAARRVDVLLTDVVMPVMNGPDLYRMLNADRPNMRVLFMSGYVPDAFDRTGLGHLAAYVLPKPFALSALLERVRAALDDRAPRSPSPPTDA